MSVQAGFVTVEEYLKLPEPKQGHTELHHGEVVLISPPKRGHQRLQHQIEMLLKRLVGETGVVWMEMAFRPASEYEVWQADVGYVSRERDAATGDDEYLAGFPDLVVEVLSPSNTVDEINEKMAVCLDNGCVTVWVVDPKRKRVLVTEGNVTKHYGPLEAISCNAFSGEIQVREIFE
jgi:Uma2 family endonuclease